MSVWATGSGAAPAAWAGGASRDADAAAYGGGMLIAFSVAPAVAADDTGSVSDAVARAIRVVRDSGLPHRTDAMFTTIEGEWDECMAVVRQCCDVVAESSPRVGLVLKADIRPGFSGELDAKLERLEDALDRQGDEPALIGCRAGGRSGPSSRPTATSSGRSTWPCGATPMPGVMPADYLAGLSSERSAARWRELAERPAGAPGHTLVVRDDRGVIAGFASAGPSRDEDAPTPWELYAVNLAAAARGTGVADLLLDELVGRRDATLWVVEANARARAFYTRHGFVDEGGRSTHEGTGTPEIRMVRRASAR